MDWLDRMNRAMDYIEGHLKETVDINQAAQMACCSTYQFEWRQAVGLHPFFLA
jgi:AraC family transcriptional regulator